MGHQKVKLFNFDLKDNLFFESVLFSLVFEIFLFFQKIVIKLSEEKHNNYNFKLSLRISLKISLYLLSVNLSLFRNYLRSGSV